MGIFVSNLQKNKSKPMKKYVFSIKKAIIFCVINAILFSCGEKSEKIVFPAVFDQAVPESQPGHSNLWKISGKDLQKPSYLFGTVHLLCLEDMFFTENFKTAFREIEQIAFEIDMTDLSKMVGAVQGAMMTETSLSQLVNKEDYALIEKFFSEELLMPISFFEKQMPMMAAALVSKSVMKCKEDGSYELILQQLATQHNIPIIGLEAIEDQLDVFRKIPYEQQATMLVKSIQQLDSSRLQMQEMIQTYRNQDIEKAAAMIKDNSQELSEFEDILLKNRNQNWIEKIEKNSASKSTMYAVGAAHLGGEFGVIQLLKAQGYTVEPF